MPAKKSTSPPEEEKTKKPVTKTKPTEKKTPAAKKPAVKKTAVKKKPAAKKPSARKTAVKSTDATSGQKLTLRVPKEKIEAQQAPEAKNDNNPQAEQKKPRPKSPVNGVELPEGRRFKAGEEAREKGRRGGIKSQQVQAQRRTLREELLALLSMASKDSEGKDHTQQEYISAALIKEARNGNVRAYETIRDTIGEKQAETMKMEVAAPQFENLDAAFAKLSGDGK